MRLERDRMALGVLLLALLLGVLWLWVKPERRDTPGIAQCVGQYAAATSAADTTRIDGTIPLERGRGDLNPLTCGALRATYPKEFVTHGPPPN